MDTLAILLLSIGKLTATSSQYGHCPTPTFCEQQYRLNQSFHAWLCCRQTEARRLQDELGYPAVILREREDLWCETERRRQIWWSLWWIRWPQATPAQRREHAEIVIGLIGERAWAMGQWPPPFPAELLPMSK